MSKEEALRIIKNHPLYVGLKERIIARPVGSVFKPRYNKDNALSTAVMRMLLQELMDDGFIDVYLNYTFIRISR